jgi:alkyl hydroperoxide reductase subunit AhpF
MAKNLIEVFVEPHCPSCESVMSTVNVIAGNPANELHVYDRQKHLAAFEERHIFICPATFVNHKLVFYGVFSLNEIACYLT